MNYDAVVIGSGPNGLAAAVTLARAERSVLVVERNDRIGGGTRTAELTRPGFFHDVCSAVHPLGAASPFFAQLPLDRHGLEWLHPDVALAHPLPDGRAGVVWRDLERTAKGLQIDADAYRRHVGGMVERWSLINDDVLGPLLSLPRHPLAFTRFGLTSLPPAARLGAHWFTTAEARALFAGCAGHAVLPLGRPLTAGFGALLLTLAHVGGWPVAKGGSAAITTALAAHLEELGGEVCTNTEVHTLRDLPPSRAVLFDLAPRQVASIAGDELPPRFRHRLRRFRHGPGAFKIDYALSGPVPWTNPECRKAGTLHLGGTAEELADAMRSVGAGNVADSPYVLVSQQSLVDPSRAPAGRHTLWAYCHVPNGCPIDMTERIDRQIERFAPGFRDLVIGRHIASPAWFERYNPAYVGGDISGGAHTGLQLLARPTLSRHPYRTPNPRLFIGSASTPPGGGVHGMAGHRAAHAMLSTVLR